MNPPAREPRRRAGLPLLVVPVSFYLAMTIGVPLVNGTAERGFWEHALTTMAVAGAIIAVALARRRQSAFPTIVAMLTIRQRCPSFSRLMLCRKSQKVNDRLDREWKRALGVKGFEQLVRLLDRVPSAGSAVNGPRSKRTPRRNSE